MPQATHSVNDYIEDIIDHTSLADVLGVLSQICADKSAHVHENWGDEDYADRWREASDKILKLAEECEL